jgi:ATP-binding cassette subfamily C protein CydD
MTTIATDAARVKAWTRGETKSGRAAVRPLLLIGLSQVGLAVGQAWCVAVILGDLLAGHPIVAWPLAAFAAGGLMRAALQYGAGLRAVAAGASARRRLRANALSRVLGAGPGGMRGAMEGDLATLLVDQIEGVDGFYARWLPAASLASTAPLLVLLIVLPVDPHAALVLLIAGLAVPVFQAVFGIGAAAASRRQFAALARLQVRFVDRMRGIATIVLSDGVEAEAQALAAAADDLRRRTMRILRVAFLSSAALDCAMVAALVAIALAGRRALFIHPTALGASRALFALIVVPEFFAPLRNFALAYQDKNRIVGAAEKLALLPEPPAPADTAPAIRNVVAHGVTVAFENVGFAWDQQRGPVLRNLSFRVPAGETAVLVGPSGAGKSTVIELMLGFVAPQSGRITINGADIASIVPEALSRMTSWIGQRPVLFAGTMRENILFARPDATEGELADAVRAARLEALVASLPDGLETRLGEGGFGLSGGQAQRVAIARAFLRNAPLLLLDEPTAHLDPATEGELLESLRRLALRRTVILASHSNAAHAFAGKIVDLAPVADPAEVVA